jgi:hypothetical protein
MPATVEIHKVPVVCVHDLLRLLAALGIMSLHGNDGVARQQFLLIALEMASFHIPKPLDKAIARRQDAMRFAADVQATRRFRSTQHVRPVLRKPGDMEGVVRSL